MLSSIGPSNAGKIQCVVMDFHAENENTVLRSFDLYFFKKSWSQKYVWNWIKIKDDDGLTSFSTSATGYLFVKNRTIPGLQTVIGQNQQSHSLPLQWKPFIPIIVASLHISSPIGWRQSLDPSRQLSLFWRWYIWFGTCQEPLLHSNIPETFSSPLSFQLLVVSILHVPL